MEKCGERVREMRTRAVSCSTASDQVQRTRDNKGTLQREKGRQVCRTQDRHVSSHWESQALGRINK